MTESGDNNRKELVNQLYTCGYICIYIRYLLDKSLFLGMLQLSTLYALTMIRKLCEESDGHLLVITEAGDDDESGEDIIRLLVLKCLRATQLLYLSMVGYICLIRYLVPVPYGRTLLVLFIGEYDDDELNELYLYKIYCWIYMLDIVLCLLTLVITSLSVTQLSRIIESPLQSHSNCNEIVAILQVFGHNSKNKYGIMALLGTNLFTAPSTPPIHEDEPETGNEQLLDGYGSIMI